MADQDRIAKRAHELFLQRGSVPGNELDDWLAAEAEVTAADGVTAQAPTASPEAQAPAGAPRKGRRDSPPTQPGSRRALRT